MVFKWLAKRLRPQPARASSAPSAAPNPPPQSHTQENICQASPTAHSSTPPSPTPSSRKVSDEDYHKNPTVYFSQHSLLDDRKYQQCFHNITNIDQLKILLDSKVDPNQTDEYGRTLLFSLTNTPDMINLLIQHNANVNHVTENNECVLHTIYNHDICRILLENNANPNISMNITNFTPLYNAINEDITLLLLEYKANVNSLSLNGQTPLHNCKTSKQAQILLEHNASINITNSTGQKPILCSLNSDILQVLLDSKSDHTDRDYYGRNILHLASLSSKEDIIRLILQTKDKWGNCVPVLAKDSQGMTPLHYAQTPSIVQLLVDKSSNYTDIPDNYGRTPLSYIYNYDTTKILLDYKSDPSYTDIMGNTILYRTINDDNLNIIELILQYKCDVNYSNNLGQTALFYAKSPLYIDLLIKYNANINHQTIHGYTILYKLHDINLLRHIISYPTCDITLINTLGQNILHSCNNIVLYCILLFKNTILHDTITMSDTYEDIINQLIQYYIDNNTSNIMINHHNNHIFINNGHDSDGSTPYSKNNYYDNNRNNNDNTTSSSSSIHEYSCSVVRDSTGNSLDDYDDDDDTSNHAMDSNDDDYVLPGYNIINSMQCNDDNNNKSNKHYYRQYKSSIVRTCIIPGSLYIYKDDDDDDDDDNDSNGNNIDINTHNSSVNLISDDDSDLSPRCRQPISPFYRILTPNSLKCLSVIDNKGNTPILNAESLDIIKLLIFLGDDPFSINIQTKSTILHSIFEKYMGSVLEYDKTTHILNIELFIQLILNINYRNSRNYIPLTLYLQSSPLDHYIIYLFIQYGSMYMQYSYTVSLPPHGYVIQNDVYTLLLDSCGTNDLNIVCK